MTGIVRPKRQTRSRPRDLKPREPSLANTRWVFILSESFLRHSAHCGDTLAQTYWDPPCGDARRVETCEGISTEVEDYERTFFGAIECDWVGLGAIRCDQTRRESGLIVVVVEDMGR